MESHEAGPIRVFLVDDHEVVRAGIKSLLDRDPAMEVVGEAASATATLQGLKQTKPDVLVLDVRLPDGNGIEICGEVTRRFPTIRTILYTSLADDTSRVAAHAAGARGYLLKRAHTDELLSAIRTVSAGADLLDGSPSETENDDSPVRRMAVLSPQEKAVVHLVGLGMTNKQIAREMALAEKTVKNYVSNVLTKLGMARRTQVASFVANAEGGMEHLTISESWDEAGISLESV
jgi:two-component system, NarL family, response regulator DevR